MGDIVKFPSNGNEAAGYLALPESGTGPGVIVVQEWWGLDSGIKEMADRLAAAGFVALAPDLYHGELAGHTEMDKAGELMNVAAARSCRARHERRGRLPRRPRRRRPATGSVCRVLHGRHAHVRARRAAARQGQGRRAVLRVPAAATTSPTTRRSRRRSRATWPSTTTSSRRRRPCTSRQELQATRQGRHVHRARRAPATRSWRRTTRSAPRTRRSTTEIWPQATAFLHDTARLTGGRR